jgi:hypothetical protein
LNGRRWGAVGGDGLALESGDDGASWSSFQVGTNGDLTSLRKYGSVLIAAGDRKTILRGDSMGSLLPAFGIPFGITGLIPDGSNGMPAYGSGGDLFRLSQDARPALLANVGTRHDIISASVSPAVHRITWSRASATSLNHRMAHHGPRSIRLYKNTITALIWSPSTHPPTEHVYLHRLNQDDCLQG